MDNPNTTHIEHSSGDVLLNEALGRLIEQLTSSEALARFRNAEQAMMNSAEAIALLNQLAQAQQKVNQQKANGSPAQADLNHLYTLQNQVAEHPLIQEYEYSREVWMGLIRQVNQEISQNIGLDYAALTRHW